MSEIPQSSVTGAPAEGWRLPRGTHSLPEVHGTIPIPATAGFF
jgi:hypothetical protein